MRKVVHKCFWAWDFDKEEEWLNEMAAKGLALVSVGFCRYEFEECTPGEYGIQLELLDCRARSAEGQRYISFVEETGAEFVGTWIRWVYFRKKLENGGEFRMFSDKDSVIAHLKRIIVFVSILGIAVLPVGLANVAIGLDGNMSNLYIGLMDVAMGAGALTGAFRLRKKKKLLENERMVSE